MAETFLVFKTVNAQIGSVVLDCSVQETHTDEVDVTEHPVEEGADIADHARPKPAQLTIEGLISNTPLGVDRSPELLRNVQANNLPTDSSSTSKFVQERSGQAYRDLLALKDGGQTLTVVTGLRSYDSMKIISLVVPRTAQSGQALQFTAQLKQILVVSSRAAPIQIPKGRPKTKLGPKGTTHDPPAKRRSMAKFLEDHVAPGTSADAAGGVIGNLVKGMVGF